jgi:SAM-dependent MidA family methyltransferase
MNETEWIVSKGFAKPDYVFEMDLLDKEWCKTIGAQCPIKGNRPNRQTSGVYLLFDYGYVGGNGIIPLYVGKATTMRQRLAEHQHGEWRSTYAKRYWELAWDSDIYTGVDFVMVWLTQDRVGLERKLQLALSPILNKRVD